MGATGVNQDRGAIRETAGSTIGQGDPFSVVQLTRSGTYSLAPWPNATLGVPDGVAEIAVRELSTGKLRESTAGLLTINNAEESGWVYAGLGTSSYSPVVVELNIAGWWSCSVRAGLSQRGCS